MSTSHVGVSTNPYIVFRSEVCSVVGVGVVVVGVVVVGVFLLFLFASDEGITVCISSMCMI